MSDGIEERHNREDYRGERSEQWRKKKCETKEKAAGKVERVYENCKGRERVGNE